MGKISKQWSGLLREAFTDADYFGITFPMDLDVKMKAVMIGACFLIVSTLALLQIRVLRFVIVSTLQKYSFCEQCWRIVISVIVMLGFGSYNSACTILCMAPRIIDVHVLPGIYFGMMWL